MTEAGNQLSSWRRTGCAVFGLAVVLSLVLMAPRAPAAQGPYEPNDTVLDAAGPLLLDQTLTAGLEAPGDRDVYIFYVTSAGESQVTLTVRNLGGSGRSTDLAATILDSESTPVGGLSFVSRGEAKSVTLSLGPQKYFVEVAPNEGFGDAYSLTPSGTGGAFGPYSTIAGKCARATAAVKRARTRLTRAQAKLQRTTARVRRSRFGTEEAQSAAQAAYRKARARVTAAKRALKSAKASQKPWCLIPQ
jgi:hypothetical protein